jgi:two-component system response regulator PilR (NtrC family)
MQVKLLRAIQEKKVRVVGSTVEETVDVRIISATHKNLNAMMEKGEFRQDLYYRLNVIQLKMPSLRERPEDIPELTERLLGKLCQNQNISKPGIAAEAKVYIQQLQFHGNVRELENMLERALALCDGITIAIEDLSLEDMPALPVSDKPVMPWHSPHVEDNTAPAINPVLRSESAIPHEATLKPSAAGNTMLPMDVSLSDYLEDIEKRTILQALEKTNNNKTAAAKLLGISFRTLRYRLSKLGLSKEQDLEDGDSADNEEE